MTPEAHHSAAIEILDEALRGEPVERCLTRWSRASRFAGSKDRAAIRDLVFNALRCRNSFAHAGGADTARGIVLGGAYLDGADLDALFSGKGYGPAALSDAERAGVTRTPSETPAISLDFLREFEADLRASLGADFEPVLRAMQARAPVDLRVNFIKTDRETAIAILAQDGILSAPLDQCATALRVGEGARKIKASRAYLEGFVELQDLSSQSVAHFADPKPGMKVLDYCAGGGGKVLALGALMGGNGALCAFDVNQSRMKDLPERAVRAGLDVKICKPQDLSLMESSCDLVLVDAPCSGSGAWRRMPQQKWMLTRKRLDDLHGMQADALENGARYVRPGGTLIFATCSIFASENEAQTLRFLNAHSGWDASQPTRLNPTTGGDGFYFVKLQKTSK